MQREIADPCIYYL